MRHLFKKLIVWTLYLAMAVGMLPGLARGAKALEPDAGASSGLAKDDEGYYLISNYAELLLFADIVNNGETGAKAILTGDINAEDSSNGSTWTPIGTPLKSYKGIFDGKGFKIEGLATSDASVDCVGLFGWVGEGGSVINVGLEGGYITGGYCVGGVVGYNEKGTVSECYNTGTVSGDYNVGGVVGFNSGTVTNCNNTGDVTGIGNNVGGVVGNNNEYSTVSRCYNTGTVTGSGASVGGVAGDNEGTVSNCYNIGKVTGSSNFVGGMVGCNYGTVSNCYNTGNVSGNDDVDGSNGVGGVAGYNSGGVISNCYNAGVVGGSGVYVGGVVGYNLSDKVLSCYNTGNVNGGNFVGGVVGYNEKVTVSNCYNTGDVNGDVFVGGVVGDNGGKVSNCYNTGDVNGNDFIGGVAGNTNGGTVSNCYCNKFICQVGAINFYDDGNNAKGLATLQMIGMSDSLSSLQNNDTNGPVWLFKTNSDGIYYYPHLAGFNFDKSGKQLPAEDIPADEWPNKGTFSVTLSEDQFIYNGETYKPEVKVTLDNAEETGYKVVYFDSGNKKIEESKDAGVYHACVYWEDDAVSGFEKTFEILPSPVTLTADSDTKVYDGTALTKDSYTISGLADGDKIENITLTGTQTDVGTTDNVPSSAKIVNASGEDVTGCYDITYVNGTLTVTKPAAPKLADDQKPAPKQDLKEDGKEQVLVLDPAKLPDGYTIEYSTDGGKTWKAAPTGTQSGEYTIEVKYTADGNHTDFFGDTLKVMIQGVYNKTESDGDWTKGSGKTYTFRIKKAFNDEVCFDNFMGVLVDGKQAKAGENYTAVKGSTVITFAADYLETLTVGEHMVRVIFKDGEILLPLKILEAVATPTPAVDATPVTGDTANPFLFVALILVSIAGVAVMIERRRHRTGI